MTRFLRATSEDYARLFVMFRWPALLAGLTGLVMTIGTLIQGPITELRTVGPVPAGTPITSTLPGLLTLDVFVSPPADEIVCRDAQGKAISHLRFPIPSDRLIDGLPWWGTATQVKLREGESATCAAKGGSGGQVLLVHRTGLLRVIFAGLAGAVTLIGLVYWLVGHRIARRSSRVAS